MNILENAKKGISSPEVKYIAEKEELSEQFVLENLASGKIVIFKSTLRDINPVAVGINTTTKVNANIGTSPDQFELEIELEKLRVAEKSGADAIMDLSTGGDLALFRNEILKNSSIPLGTVPLYEVAVNMSKQGKSIMDMTIDDFLTVVENQAKEGVDFMTIHSGITQKSIESLKSQDRIVGITSRGGSIIAEWMSRHNKENPLYEHYDQILDLMRDYNVVMSLGDGLRPGATYDASDRGQIHEMIVLGELAKRSKDSGVQAIIEGPGHVQLDMIADNMKLQKSLCEGAPYYILGPLVTDIAPGYDHITGAIGGAIAAAAGADFLCYVTPAEHLRLPDASDVKEGVIASKIAAHAADMVKLGNKAKKIDNKMSEARKKRDWETMYSLALDEEKARRYRKEIPSDVEDQCSMCGEFCAIKREY